MQKKFLFIIGTRPEIIKLAPLIILTKQNPNIHTQICLTAQHREMLDIQLAYFNLTAYFDLDIMSHNQSLSELSANILLALEPVLNDTAPDRIIVQGDTNSAFIAALACHYHKIPVAHIEAGLRTHARYSPFPEELNRKLLATLSDLHFAPTIRAKRNLLKEGINKNTIFVTGNTGIDALLISKEKIENKQLNLNQFSDFQYIKHIKAPMILVTGHRRENIENGLNELYHALSKTAKKYPQWNIVYPTHPNPKIQEKIKQQIKTLPNIHITPNLSYPVFVYLMLQAKIILTDSGGIQEEAPTLGKPTLILRKSTERPETIKAKSGQIVEMNSCLIVNAIEKLITNQKHYRKMSVVSYPYGNGTAAARHGEAKPRSRSPW